MKLIKILFPKRQTQTPIRSTRKKILLNGITYSIALKQGSRNTSHIDTETSTITFTLKAMTKENLETYAKSWYRREARKLFKSSIDKWLTLMRRMGYNVETPQIKLYRMNRAWGRCYYTKGVITLNLLLAATPTECIDCITLHELCHFLEHSHSKVFYDLMTHIDDTWRGKEVMLNGFAKANFTSRPLFPLYL